MQMHVCILAAGQSKRMKSKISKLLHPLCGKPMILHVQKTISDLEPKTCTVVVGYQRDQVINALESKPVDFIVQEEQLGTGHAVGEFLKNHPRIHGLLFVTNGDTPLVRAGTLRVLASFHTQQNAAISLLTAEVPDARGYGRIVRNREGMIQKIVEEADATDKDKMIHEINAGIYLCDIETMRRLIPQVKTNNRQKEFYLTDVIELALKQGLNVFPLKAPAEETMGINTKIDLATAERVLRRRINEDWMLRGVTMRNPESTYIDVEVQIGTDAVLYPNVYLEGSTMIGSEVTIYPNCRIVDSYIDSQCVVWAICANSSRFVH
jgi:bifunctional UDP-N-acetylglucosamine pyrophosphorylase/glucosamine-1-phosphate N-acetyltransferase